MTLFTCDLQPRYGFLVRVEDGVEVGVEFKDVKEAVL